MRRGSAATGDAASKHASRISTRIDSLPPDRRVHTPLQVRLPIRPAAPLAQPPPTPHTPRMAPPLLLLQDIHLSLGSAPLLQGAELGVGAGERNCLVGRNGYGTSTLL